jgi:ribonucleoside-diphosphate reductase alpha chain
MTTHKRGYMSKPFFETDISKRVWETRYCLCDGEAIIDPTLESTWQRIAHALASCENKPELWEKRFYRVLKGFHFLPGGRILAGAGSNRKVTLFNCFVMGRIEDSRTGIDKALNEGAITMQHGGGVGYDFSTLRPRGSEGWQKGDTAPGPVSLMHEWDDMCAKLLSGDARRGAMMGTLRCDHPDIELFINAKRSPGELLNFNLSILISDAFMQAVDNDADWPLLYPAEGLHESDRRRYPETLERLWSGAAHPVSCHVHRHIRARDLWQHIMRANYDTAEPGVLFIDRINDLNNLGYREQISATNPCGEVPLPPYGACDLGSINLTRFVKQPFTTEAHMDIEGIRDTTGIAVRMLDNVIDLSRFPLEAQRQQTQGNRRIGLGITGLADTLIMLGLHYGKAPARQQAKEIMQTVCHTAYRSSIALAKEKGSFPFYDEKRYLAQAYIRALPEDIREAIAASGIRNSHLTAIAPTGTISLLANNISSGIEPVFSFEYQRRLREADGSYCNYPLVNYARRQWQSLFNDRPLPDYFVASADLTPQAQLLMQSVLQPYVDNAISKTINVPESFDFDAFRQVYEQAFELGLKGCTTYRPNPVRGAVMTPAARDY